MNNNTGNQDVNLKVLYTFDNTTNFLARSSTPLTARVITLPPQPPHNGSIIGLIDLQSCLSLITRTSPECFSNKSLDYSIYSKDVIEPDEPYVGFGLFSKVMELNQPHVIVPGRICKNFLSSLFGNSGDANVDTLEIKLRLSAVNALSNPGNSDSYQGSISNTTTVLAPPLPLSKTTKKTKKRKIISSPTENYEPHPTLKKRQPDSTQYLPPPPPPQQQTAIQPPVNTKNTQPRNSSQPELATRTQSMPFIQPVNPQNDVSSRFANFINKQSTVSKVNAPMRAARSNTESFPIKARKTKSFIRSVVKVGDAGGISNDSRKCINCKLSVPPFKYYNSGIFEFGNSGFLCCVCNDYYVTDNTDSLRSRGELAAKGFLDVHYNKNTKKKFQRKRNANKADDDLTNSSPVTNGPTSSSSPLAAVAMAKSRNATSRKSSSSINQSNYKNHEIHNNPQFMTALDEMLITDSLPDYMNDGPKNVQHPLTDIDPLYQPDRQPTPPSQKEDDQPINATKLNTTLIPLDDDDKENIPPSHQLHSHSPILEEEKPHSIFGHEMLSPSLQRLIESMPGDVGASSSPSKPSNNTDIWMNELFTHKEHPNEQAEEEDDDDEINKLINESKIHHSTTTTNNNSTFATKELMTSNNDTPSGKYDKTPADKFTPADTVQTATISSESNTPCTNINNTPIASAKNIKSNTPKTNLSTSTTMTSKNPYYNTTFNNNSKQTSNRKKLTMNNLPSSPYLILPHEDQTNDIDDDDEEEDGNDTSLMDHWGNQDSDRIRGDRTSSITEINDDDK